MHQVLDGAKKVFQIYDVKQCPTLNTPEFEKKTILKLVENNTEFIKYCTDEMLKNPEKFPKDYLWSIVSTLDPVFTKEYVKSAIEHSRKSKNKRETNTIVMSQEHMDLFRKLRIVPKNSVLKAVKKREYKKPE